MIEAEGLARVFKSRRQTVEAVRGIDIKVAAGEIVGFETEVRKLVTSGRTRWRCG